MIRVDEGACSERIQIIRCDINWNRSRIVDMLKMT
jgi:hypothetical protein